MDQNNNTNNQNYLSGFDSVEQAPAKKEGSFNPTPMFSGLNPQGEQAIPETKKVEAVETDTPSAPVNANPVSTESAPTNQAVQNEVKEFVAQPTSFIPNGTYSYSATPNTAEAKPQPEIKPVNTEPFNPVNTESSYTPPPFSPNGFSSVESVTPVQPQNGKKPKKEAKPKKYGAGVIFVSALLAAIIGAGSGVFGVLITGKYFNTASTPVKQEVSQNVTNITVDETVNSSIEAVAKKAGPSIIGIRTTAAVTNFFGGSSEATGEGSGIIYTKDGYIITNYHVIESAVESANSKVEVFLANDTKTAIPATIIGYNISSDLAVVKIEKNNLPAITFADSDKLNVGQYAIAIGNPGGLEFIGSISSGIISGLNRSVTIGTGNTMSLIQTDAAINPGNSGGALVDINGNLIGVNSVKLVSTGYEGMGFAIPSNTVKEICDNIIAKQNDPTPYIGIEISQSYSSEQLIALGYPAGAVVVSVAEGSPAYEGQIQRGDIITEFNGTQINDYKQLENAIALCKPGDSVTVKIFRAGRFYSSHINVAANNAQ